MVSETHRGTGSPKTSFKGCVTLRFRNPPRIDYLEILPCSYPMVSRLQHTSANNYCHDCEMLLPLTAVTANSCRHYSVAVCSNRGCSTHLQTTTAVTANSCRLYSVEVCSNRGCSTHLQTTTAVTANRSVVEIADSALKRIDGLQAF